MQKQTQLVEQNQGFSYRRHPATDDAVGSVTDLARIFGGPTHHLTGVDGVSHTGVDYAIGKNAKTNPNYVAKTYTIPFRFRRGA